VIGRFEFAARNECVCGASLSGVQNYVTKRFSPGEVRFGRCTACGSWCQSPIITERTLARWIDSEEYRGSEKKAGVGYADYAADEKNRIVEARGRYRCHLAPLLKAQCNVLEVGCATGSLLSVIRENGHHVTGVDLSATFARAAKSLHALDVRLGNFLDIDLPPHHFDAILAMGTVSNFLDPVRCLRRFGELLAPGGFVTFNFPDADSLWVRVVYRDHFWMFTPSARTIMTLRGCLAALARAGFQSIRVAKDTQRPTLRKLLHHGKAGFLLPMITRLGFADVATPVSIPVPTVRLLVARL